MRLPLVLVGHCTYIVWAKILSALNIKHINSWLFIALFSPLLGLGSLAATPDVPLVFFWSLSLLAFIKSINTKSWIWYSLLGVFLGLGFCSKYMIVLFVPSLFIALLYARSFGQIKWAYVPLTIVFGLVFCLPVLLWNHQNEWISFKFQLNHGLSSKAWSYKYVLEYVGGQIALIFPLLLIDLFTKNKTKEAKLLFSFTVFPLLFFLYSSFKAHVEANWPIIAYPSLYALTVLKGSIKRVQITLIFWATVILILFTQIALEYLPIDNSKLKIYESMKFSVVVSDYKNRSLDENTQVFTASYQMASVVSLKANQIVPKLKGLNRVDYFDFRSDSTPSKEKVVLYLQNDQRPPDEVLKLGYKIDNKRKLNQHFQVVELSRTK